METAPVKTVRGERQAAMLKWLESEEGEAFVSELKDLRRRGGVSMLHLWRQRCPAEWQADCTKWYQSLYNCLVQAGIHVSNKQLVEQFRQDPTEGEDPLPVGETPEPLRPVFDEVCRQVGDTDKLLQWLAEWSDKRKQP